MIRFFKNISLVATLAVLTYSCSPKLTNTVAIIVDSETYNNCSTELDAYRQVIEKGRVKAKIITSEWENPIQVRDTILSLKKSKPSLEGVVLVGNIPIVKVRGAQHLTTAFKMNERTFPKEQSSVASDRFYDDFDLKFDFLCRDSVNNNIFYYRLSEEGEQSIKSDIYSARIKVPSTMSGDSYKYMKDYLVKVLKAHKENNPLDNIIFFAGNGYNSDCMTIWRQKPIIFRDYFPAAFKSSSSNKFYNFRQDPKIKFKLFNEIQREDVDLFLFSEHGAYDTQYLNGAPEGENLTDNLKYLKESLQSAYKRYKGGKNEEAFINEVVSEYLLPSSIFSDEEMKKRADNTPRLSDENIVLEEIEKLKTGPRVAIFDACYNGSFHESGYVAGYHTFNPGKCIVTQGNTVNVLQDKWEDQLIGYFSIGLKAGLWQKEFNFLESHMIGDPTFSFTPTDPKMSEKIYSALTNGKENSRFWNSLLKEEIPIYRATAIKHLGKRVSSYELLQIFNNDESPIVRQQAFNSLMDYDDNNRVEGIKKGLFDQFEVIRVTAARCAGNVGDESLIPYLIRAAYYYPEAQRLQYGAMTSLSVFSLESIQKAFEVHPDLNFDYLKGRAEWLKKELMSAIDTTATYNKRESSIRTFRNYNLHYAVEELLNVLCDKNEDVNIRVVMCETLGWFDKSIGKERIKEAIIDCLKDESAPEPLVKEMKKTLKRLN